MDNSLLVENIKRFCKSKGIAPTNACFECGVGKSFISDIKRGQIPSVAKVQMLADYLGVTTSELLGEKKPPMSEDNERSALAGASEETKRAMELLNRLNSDNFDKAIDHLEYLLARQKESEGKK